MKKTLLSFFAAFLFLLGSNEKAQAQITAISVDSGYVYSQMNCMLPATAYLSVAGMYTGTAPANDSIDIYVNWGDGSDTTFKTAATSGWFWANLNHVYTVAGTYAPLIVGTTSNNLTDTLVGSSITVDNSCAPMTGRLFIDANSDCIYNPGEVAIANKWVKFEDQVTNNVYFAVTDQNGEYQYGLLPGTYDISLSTLPGALSPSCPTSGVITQVVTSGGSYNNDFGYTCSTSAPVDLSVNAYAGNWRHGFDRPLFIQVSSTNACTNSPATLTVTLPTHLTYSSPYPGYSAPTTVSGQTLAWNIPNLNGLGNWYTYVMIHCSTAATLGDTLCVTATITPGTPDANPSNNTDIVCAEVNNSFDPNDKHVTPRGDGATGDIVNGTPLTYLINFQNTGNDVAYNISITDEIDSDLDISTFRVITSSHTMTPTINGNMVTFRFDNINLPDSGANEPGSHGHVIYTIEPKANLALGTQINNTANIYFDYNDAIVTNTTLNTIAAPQSIRQVSTGNLKATIYPNPASGQVYVELDNANEFKAELYDVLGRQVKLTKGANGRAAISVKELPSGTYVLRLSNNANEVLVTKINVVQ